MDADPAQQRRYVDLMPVTFVDNVELARWRVQPVQLRTALQGDRPA